MIQLRIATNFEYDQYFVHIFHEEIINAYEKSLNNLRSGPRQEYTWVFE